MIDKQSRKVIYAVLGFGNFLGMGDDHHPVPLGRLSFDTTRNGFITDITEEAVKGVPDCKRRRGTMWDWLVENASPLQAIVGIVTAVVWIIYLQILVSGLRRQRRTEILIHLGGSRSSDARTFISNLGFEPIYILEILLTTWTKDGERETSVVDRSETAKKDLSSASASTFQGPLDSGEYIDIGSFDNLLERARWNISKKLDPSAIERVEMKVAAISAASSAVVASKRQFDVESGEDGCRLRPRTLYATQIRSWWGRYRLKRQLWAKLKE